MLALFSCVIRPGHRNLLSVIQKYQCQYNIPTIHNGSDIDSLVKDFTSQIQLALNKSRVEIKPGKNFQPPELRLLLRQRNAADGSISEPGTSTNFVRQSSLLPINLHKTAGPATLDRFPARITLRGKL
ncbi:hypothetical protein X975_00710, partial [Stegodyphus mimosarum]